MEDDEENFVSQDGFVPRRVRDFVHRLTHRHEAPPVPPEVEMASLGPRQPQEPLPAEEQPFRDAVSFTRSMSEPDENTDRPYFHEVQLPEPGSLGAFRTMSNDRAALFNRGYSPEQIGNLMAARNLKRRGMLDIDSTPHETNTSSSSRTGIGTRILRHLCLCCDTRAVSEIPWDELRPQSPQDQLVRQHGLRLLQNAQPFMRDLVMGETSIQSPPDDGPHFCYGMQTPHRARTQSDIAIGSRESARSPRLSTTEPIYTPPHDRRSAHSASIDGIAEMEAEAAKRASPTSKSESKSTSLPSRAATVP